MDTTPFPMRSPRPVVGATDGIDTGMFDVDVIFFVRAFIITSLRLARIVSLELTPIRNNLYCLTFLERQLPL